MDELLEQLNQELVEEMECCRGCGHENHVARDYCKMCGCGTYGNIRDLEQHIEYIRRDMEERNGTGI